MLGLMPICLVGCQVEPMVDSPEADDDEEVTSVAKPQGYVALPGQAATANTVSDTTAAFEAAAAVYTAPVAKPAPQPVTPAEPAPLNPDPMIPQAAPAPAPAPLPSPAVGSTAVVAQPAGHAASYAVQITNGTTGRLFVEVQDASGNIFPFGFMYANQRLSTPPQEPRPIQGRLTVVIRDPDSPGAPEVRRYQVPVPAQYEGKTLGITILPGRFRASVDGNVYYTSPLPETPPAAPAAPAA